MGETTDLESIETNITPKKFQWLLYYLIEVLPLDSEWQKGLNGAEPGDHSVLLRVLKELKKLYLTHNFDLTIENNNYYQLILRELFKGLHPQKTQDTMALFRFALKSGFGEIIANESFTTLTNDIHSWDFQGLVEEMLTIILECNELTTLQIIIDEITSQTEPLAGLDLLDYFILSNHYSLILLKLALNTQDTKSFVKALIRRVHGSPLINLNAISPSNGQTILHIVGQLGFNCLFDDLVALRANPDLEDHYGMSPRIYLELKLALEDMLSEHPNPALEDGESDDDPPLKKAKKTLSDR